MPHPLDYHRPTPEPATRRPPNVRAFAGTVVGAEVVTVGLSLMLLGGGPILPWTLAFAPVAVIAELLNVGDALGLVLRLVVGPLVLGLYALAATAYPLWYVWTALGCFHLACFVVVCWLRGVTWWPWG